MQCILLKQIYALANICENFFIDVNTMPQFSHNMITTLQHNMITTLQHNMITALCTAKPICRPQES